MLLIAGTIPDNVFPFVAGEVVMQDGRLQVENQTFPCTQGTAAMISSALTTTAYLGLKPPRAVVVGDNGSGEGSRQIYRYLIEHLADLAPETLALHYWMPDLGLMQELIAAVAKCRQRPLLIADAASMYTAKAVGQAGAFDVFTPDASELAFLADPQAFHPAYINKHLFEAESPQTPELIKKAYAVAGSAKALLVKGAVDYIVINGEIVEVVSEPDLPVLECIGGTGDTITGMVAAFCYAELELQDALTVSARANRLAGRLADVVPASGIGNLIAKLPQVFRENLCSWCGVCSKEGS